jgi:hypothetical protein
VIYSCVDKLLSAGPKDFDVEPASPSSTDKSGLQTGGDPDFNAVPQAEEDAGLCPSCQKKLIDPHGLGWCKACGYCKSLEDDKTRTPLENKRQSRTASPLGLVEFGRAVNLWPTWVWVLIGGVLTVVAISLPPAASLEVGSLQRALWSTAEIVLGVLMVLAAQTWSLCFLAPGEDSLHFKDAILPGRLWALTVSKLPQTCGQVWLAGWGLTCILSGIFIVGGLAHWFSYLPKTPPPVVEQPAEQAAD